MAPWGVHERSDLVASIWSWAWVFVVGFLGSKVLFGPSSDGISVGAALVPSVLLALGAFAYRLTRSEADSAPIGAAIPLHDVSDDHEFPRPTREPRSVRKLQAPGTCSAKASAE